MLLLVKARLVRTAQQVLPQVMMKGQ